MTPQRVQFYYYTGTGNTLKLVRHMSDLAEQKGIPSNMIAIDRLKKSDLVEPSVGSLTGICYPTHGFNAPWHVIKFVCRLPKKRGARVFLMNSRGGAKLLKWRLPGLSGIALLLPALILWLRGFSLRGLGSADPPSNWISLHPGWSERQAKYIFERAYRQTKRFFSVLLDGKRVMRPMLLITLPLDFGVSIVSLLYFIKGRFLLAKMYTSASGCTSCALCERSCPVGAIKMISKRPYWTFDCESCMRCVNICPEKCIQTSHSILLLLVAVFSGLGVVIHIHRVLDIDSIFNHIQSKALLYIVNFAFDWILFICSTFVIYAVVQLLIRILPFRLLFEYTSLSRYWRHYLAPGIKPKDLHPKKTH